MSDLAPAAPAAAPQNGAPRNNAGQFSPKAGATGVAEAVAPAADGAPPSGPQTVDDWKAAEFEVDVYGEKQKVKWASKAEAQREAQELRAFRKRNREISERERRLSQFDSMTPEQRADLLGFNVDDVARQKVLKAAKELDMTPEQRELEELREFRRTQAEREQAEVTRREQEQQQQQRAAARREAVSGLEKGLALSGLPKTHHAMALLAEIQQECTDQRLPPLPPDLLAAEANKRYSERGIEPLKKLQGKSLLERLGPDVVRAVLMAERERRGTIAGQPRQSVTPSRELPPPDDAKVYGEAEAEEMLRRMRNAR